MAVGNRFNGTGNGRLLLKEKPFGGRSFQLSLIVAFDSCSQPLPRGTPILIGVGWRSQTMGESRKRTEESLLSSGRFRLFHATGAGGRQVARVTPSLTQ